MFCLLICFPLRVAANPLAPAADAAIGFSAHPSKLASDSQLRRHHLAHSGSVSGPPVLANITAHLNLQDYDKEDLVEDEEEVAGNHADSTRQNSEDSTLPSPRSEEAEASDHENRSDDVEDTQETSNDAEGGDKGGECRREEKVLEEAEEKIARAQEELNKEEIREEVAEAAELEKRADLISQTESEEAEEEQIAEEV